MKKRILTTLMAVAVAMVAMAQRAITGKVIENDSQDPVPQTTVRLLKTDSTLVKGVLTNQEGRFSMQAPSAGHYIVQVTCVGFKPYAKRISVAADKNVALGTIALSPDAIMLKGATVTGNAAKVTVKADTFVYNASAYRTPEGSVVEELVRRLPGAQVSDDGTVTINGKEVKKILIDGKEFMTGDTKTAMKNLPTSIVERVRAYDQKSDQARVTGIDDGEEETVLDFGVKKGMNRGQMLNVNLGAGTQDRYSNRAFGGTQSESLKAFGMMSANNVNDMGFPGGGGGRFGGGRQGLTATKMVGFNLNYEIPKTLILDGSVRWNHSDGDAHVLKSTENFLDGSTSTFGNSSNRNYTRSNNWDVRMRLEWTPDTMTNIMFRPQFTYGSNDGLSDGRSLTFDADPYEYGSDPLNNSTTLEKMMALGYVKNRNKDTSLSYSDSKSAGARLQMNRKLSASGRNVTLTLAGNYGDGMSKSFTNNMVEYFQLVNSAGNDSTYQANRYAVTPTTNWNYSVKALYSEPILPRTYLQFSYQYQYKYSKSDRGTYDLSHVDADFFNVNAAYRGWGSYLDLLGNASLDSYRDSKLSRYSEYKNYIHTADVMLRVVRNDYNLNVGVQVVPQKSHFVQDYQNLHADTTRTVTNITPTADFRWKISDLSQLRFTYRGRTSQPSMSDLLDITDDRNPVKVQKGNP